MPQPTDPAVVRAAREHRDALIAKDRDQMQRMADKWAEIERTLEAQMSALANEIAVLQAQGIKVSPSRIFQMERYKALTAQAREQLRGFTGALAQEVASNQADYARDGIRDAASAVQLSLLYNSEITASFNLLNPSAIEGIVGMTGAGTPLERLIRTAWPYAVSGLTDELIKAVALGQNPAITAQRMKNGFGVGLDRARTIARTEQLRAYREAARAQYAASGVVGGYKRLAARSTRTCPACLFADGRVYRLESQFSDHPNGRCTLVPIVNGLKEIQWQTGQQWFNTQPRDAQIEIIGPGAYNAWRTGQIQLQQLVTETDHPTWGAGLATTPLSQLGL
jgi:SPP1 gp7 family putative phage head morphogenesis protein